jgi:hypothetical protein
VTNSAGWIVDGPSSRRALLLQNVLQADLERSGFLPPTQPWEHWPAHSQWGSVVRMGGLLAKIADIAWEIFRGGREIEARVNSAAAGALVHLEGVRDAPHGDSSEYRDEKGYLGGELKKLTLAAGERPGKFKDELEIAMLVKTLLSYAASDSSTATSPSSSASCRSTPDARETEQSASTDRTAGSGQVAAPVFCG